MSAFCLGSVCHLKNPPVQANGVSNRKTVHLDLLTETSLSSRAPRSLRCPSLPGSPSQ